MIIKKEDGTYIYQSFLAGAPRLIEDESTKSGIETRHRIGQFLIGIIFILKYLSGSGNDSSKLSYFAIIAGIIWATDLIIFVRRLPKSISSPTTREMDQSAVKNIPLPVAYLMLAGGMAGLISSIWMSVGSKDLPILILALPGLMCTGISYIGYRIIREKKSGMPSRSTPPDSTT